ncbi:hypothetical protein EW026_g5240 [Hermanssonia centrifuga]|uniref:Uncharacterized protein n=1 Tax=Hermanssonia centrifuga TaxID=98765 RepID=A0A4S4KEM6_9APHY|nr:hypothetical protein EW026_g5240 [Hermanssonia centrifuga]
MMDLKLEIPHEAFNGSAAIGMQARKPSSFMFPPSSMTERISQMMVGGIAIGKFPGITRPSGSGWMPGSSGE